MLLTLLFFFLYILAVVVIGVRAARHESEEGFMLADRRVEGVQVAATMAAGFFDATILSIYIGYVYAYGLSALWLFVGLALGFLLLRRYAVRIKRRADELRVYTMPEYFGSVLGKHNGLMFSVLLIVQFFLVLAAGLIVSGKILVLLFPVPYALAVTIGGAVILTYLLLAGFKAVVQTDFFQLLIMILMCLTALFVLFGKATVGLGPDAFNIVGIGAGNIVGFLVIGVFGVLVAPDLWQRIFATKDEVNLKRGISYTAVILPLLALIISVVGFATKHAFPGISPEDALVTGFSHLLPFGFKEFGMVLLYAVALSSSDTVTFVVSSILTRDLKNYWLKERN